MRKVNSSIEDIIQKIESLKGKDVDLEINRGRKKTVSVSGTIDKIYPSIFTVKSSGGAGNISYSYSYADVLCGDVALKSKESEVIEK